MCAQTIATPTLQGLRRDTNLTREFFRSRRASVTLRTIERQLFGEVKDESHKISPQNGAGDRRSICTE